MYVCVHISLYFTHSQLHLLWHLHTYTSICMFVCTLLCVYVCICIILRRTFWLKYFNNGFLCAAAGSKDIVVIRPLAVAALSLSLSPTFPHCARCSLNVSFVGQFHARFFEWFWPKQNWPTHVYTNISTCVCVCVWICIGVRAYIACIYACVNDLYVDVDVVEQLLAAQQQQQSSVSFRRIFALYFRLTLPGNKPNLCCLNCALPFTLQLVVVTLSCCCCCCCCVSMWKPYFNGEGNWHCYSLR